MKANDAQFRKAVAEMDAELLAIQRSALLEGRQVRSGDHKRDGSFFGRCSGSVSGGLVDNHAVEKKVEIAQGGVYPQGSSLQA